MRHRLGRFILGALAAGSIIGNAAAQEPKREVSISQGRLRGTTTPGGGTLFAGIPFAAAPVGERRWKPPAPAASWRGVRDASKPGLTCPQADAGWNRWDAAHSGEDCLNLNVWTPAGSAKARPVMVWFHGGGFVGGSGSAPTYNGAALTGNGVIVVTVNYRLGVLGFLAHPELSAESPDRVSGNYAIQDQLAALQWVNRNIARFGGDPNNVTAFGQSAGSFSVATLIAMPQARRYFRRAILESGTPFGIGNFQTLAEAERDGAELGHIKDLRAAPVNDVVAQWNRYVAAAPATRRTAPIVDGHVLRQQPSVAYFAGAAHGMPVLLGSTVREFPGPPRPALEKSAKGIFGDDAANVLGWYDAQPADALAGDTATQLITDNMFRCGTVQTARLADQAWLYHFVERTPGRPVSAHSAEVFYVFDTPGEASGGAKASFDAGQARLSHTMRNYWTNFAKTGDPNGPGLPQWPRYSMKGQDYIELGAEVRAASRLRGTACERFVERWASARQATGKH